MTEPGHVDVDTYERGVTASLDRYVATTVAQGNDFQQRLYMMGASGHLIPPQMFHAYADGLMSWIELFRQFGPAAEWLTKAGRPAVGERLAAILDDLGKAAPQYRAMAGQQMEHLRGMTSATVATNREINATWAATNAESRAAHAARSAAIRNLL